MRNHAANLSSRGRPRIANRYTSPSGVGGRWALRRFACALFAIFAVGAYTRLPAAEALSLHDCRLEHPLELTSVPARCAHLRVAEDPALRSGPAIELSVAVVPALNRRAAAAP